MSRNLLPRRFAFSLTAVMAACLFTGSFFLHLGDSPLLAQQKVVERTSLTPEREATALAFAKRHHRELASLLQQLKEMDSAKYESAISELSRTSERLTRYKDRLPERYKSDLEIWKIDSRVRLLVARSAGGMEEETREQVKNLLMQRNRLRKTQYQAERKKLQELLKRPDQQGAQLADESESIAERDLDRLMKSVRSRSVTRKRTANSKSQTTATTKEPTSKEVSRRKKIPSNKETPSPNKLKQQN